MRSLFLFTLFSCLFHLASAQDQLIKTNGDTLIVKVTEVGIDNIKFHYTGDSVLSAISKNSVRKIIFSDGQEVIITDEITDEASYARQKKSAFKISVTSPIVDKQMIFYEHSFKPGKSYEFGLGLIGTGVYIGNNKKRRDHGIQLSAGLKFLDLPLFRSRSLRFYHRLHGSYLKPEYTFSIIDAQVVSHPVSGNYTPYQELQRKRIMENAFMLSLGKQAVFSNLFLVDGYFSLGIRVNQLFDRDPSRYYYNYNEGLSLVSATHGIHIGLRAGIKIGLLH